MTIRVQLASSKELNLLTKILEGAGHLATGKILDGRQAVAEVLCTADQSSAVKGLLQELQNAQTVTILSIN